MIFDKMQVELVSGGQYWLDGGNMFGVVPRVLWAKHRPPDESNCVLLETNCVLIRHPSYVALVDTGYGSKSSAQQKRNLRLQDGNPIVKGLLERGVQREDVNLVILTHLHFDHAGGGTYLSDNGKIRPTFPNAVYVVQRIEWEDANGDLPELAGSYFVDDFRALAEANQLRFVEGELEIAPGLTVSLTGGHTRGHQAVYLRAGKECIANPADLCAYVTHIRPLWTMAYDQFPLTTRREKLKILNEATAKRWLVLFNHDPITKAAYLESDPKTGFAVAQSVEL